MTPATIIDAPPKAKKGKKVEDDRPWRPEILSFEHFVPKPRTFPRSWPTGKKYPPKSIRWCRIHWGTQWDACWPQKIRGSPRSLRYTFCTAWDDAVPWVQRVSKQFPTLKFSLHYRYDDSYRVIYGFRAGVYFYPHKGRWVVGKL